MLLCGEKSFDTTSFLKSCDSTLIYKQESSTLLHIMPLNAFHILYYLFSENDLPLIRPDRPAETVHLQKQPQLLHVR